ILNHLGYILGINVLISTTLTNLSIPTQISNIIDIESLNVTATYQQEFKKFLKSTLQSLQSMQENLIFLQNLVGFEQLSIEEQSNTTKNMLKTINENDNSCRHKSSDTKIFLLEQETKQR
ncbi:3204_t:CDS:2, partial [Gigaspora margarita]